MEGSVDPRALARQPLQERSRRRFERVLQAAEKLLLAEGLNGFSIPALAQRLRYSRAAIYQYFPTPYAILNELLKRELDALETQLTQNAKALLDQAWGDALRHIVELAADFHNTHPVGRMLILGGPVNDESHLTQAQTIQHLGQLARRLLVQAGHRVPRNPDVATLSVDIGTTCFRVSFRKHGNITPAYREEAVRAMTAYLRLYLPGD